MERPKKGEFCEYLNIAPTQKVMKKAAEPEVKSFNVKPTQDAAKEASDKE